MSRPLSGASTHGTAGHTETRLQGAGDASQLFDTMLRSGIPQYEAMRSACSVLGLQLARSGGVIVDLGCARGEALAPFVEALGSRARYFGCELSPTMLAAARERFRSEIAAGLVSIEGVDLRWQYPDAGGASLTLCVLTLHFLPIEHRPRILRRVFDSTRPGGALILVERVLGADADMETRLTAAYDELGAREPYGREIATRDRLSLEGTFTPLTAQENVAALHAAGFTPVECFWRWMNFAGWLAMKRKTAHPAGR